MTKFYFIDRDERGLLFLTSHTKAEAFAEIKSLYDFLDTKGTLIEFAVSNTEAFTYEVFSMDCGIRDAIEYWYNEKEELEFGCFEEKRIYIDGEEA